jgi:transcriptional regulator with XRE-family HTH domain
MKTKQKSLRQLSRELGVSASYLSQVTNGKRPASVKLKGSFDNYVQSVKQSVKQNPAKNGRILGNLTFGEVSELADEHDLGSCAERLGGSSPPFPTYNLGILKSKT